MFKALKARGRGLANGKVGRARAGRGKATRGKAAVTFAARLTFEDVSRRYGRALALDHVSLDIAPGEILCLLGPSGGKSTLLRVAAGVERPSAGRILLDGKEVVGANRFVPPEKRGIGLMFQDFALFPHLSILDNVAFGLSLTRREAKAEARAALERVGLAHYADEYPHILSGGEQQRVALARAIAPRPSVLLMDEPFSGLDPRLREKMWEETLAILHETRATSIVVTHDAEEAMRMCYQRCSDARRRHRADRQGARPLSRAQGHPRRAHLLGSQRIAGARRARECGHSTRPFLRQRAP